MLSTRSKCLCRMCKRIPFGWPEKRYGTNPIPGMIHGGEQPMGGTHAHCIKYVMCINQKKQPLQIVQRNFNSDILVEMLHCQLVGKFKHRLFHHLSRLPDIVTEWSQPSVFLFQGSHIEEHVLVSTWDFSPVWEKSMGICWSRGLSGLCNRCWQSMGNSGGRRRALILASIR